MSRGPSWRRPISLIAAAMFLVLLPAGPTQAAYQATVDSNESAFLPPCAGFTDSLPAKMLKAATTAYKALGYATGSYTTTSFTRAHTLARTDTDWAYYVHSHGDYYWHPGDQRRYSGFREDAGKCSQAVIYSKDIAQRRAGHATNLVVISTCHNAEPNTTLPGAFGIAKTKGTVDQLGPTFYMSYLGTAYDNDEWVFEQRFWDALSTVHTVGQAFDIANLGSFTHSDFAADWWGSYTWYGFAGPLVFDCPRCL
ncbi:MAG: hypothetical protein QOE66_2008 [Chloroflexota bacterium]|nr:hypothetical protein [Chloroflexota bacterium]